MTFEVGQGVSGINPEGFHASVWERGQFFVFSHFSNFVVLQTDVTALQTQRGSGIFGQKMAPSDSLVQRFLWKNRKNGIFEALFQ